MLRLYAIQDQLQGLSTFVDTLRIQSAVMNELHAERERREREGEREGSEQVRGGGRERGMEGVRERGMKGGRKSNVDDFEM